MNVFCDFQPIEDRPGWCQCGRPECGVVLPVPAHTAMPVAICKTSEADTANGCVFLADPTEKDAEIAKKPGCPGNKRTSVWECDKHGRCSPYAVTTDPTIQACADCGDYRQER